MRSTLAVKAVLLASLGAACLSVAVSSLPAPADLAPATLVVLTGVKLALLAAAAHWSFVSRKRLHAGPRIARAWGLLCAGFAGLALGHVVLSLEQVLYANPPFPATSDVLFIAGQVFLVAALSDFLGAYRESGLFSEKGAHRALVVAIAGAAILGGLLLVTIARLPAPWLERATSSTYALLDLAILMTLALLVRQARQLGGQVGRAWALLLGGFTVFSAADVAFGYLHALDSEPSLLLSQVPFLVAYGLASAGTRLQLALIAVEPGRRDSPAPRH